MNSYEQQESKHQILLHMLCFTFNKGKFPVESIRLNELFFSYPDTTNCI